jgi:hypothetical protein
MPKKMSFEEIGKLFGMDLSATLQSEEAQQAVTQQTEYEALEDNRTLEAESVIFYIETKGSEAIWKRRTCKLCGSKFLSTYTGVGYCSNNCRKDYLASKGLKWDPTGKTEAERWGGTIPKVIGPTATETLKGMTFPDDPEPESKESSSPVEEDNDDFDMDAFLNDDL